MHEACDVAYASPRRRSSHLHVVTLTVADVHVYNPLTVADVYIYNLFPIPPHIYTYIHTYIHTYVVKTYPSIDPIAAPPPPDIINI